MKTFDTRLGFGNDVIQYADATGDLLCLFFVQLSACVEHVTS